MLKTTLKNTFWILALGTLWILLTPAASSAADLPHGRDCNTATAIQFGAKVETAFSNSGDRAVYRVVLNARGLLDVMMSDGDAHVGDVELLDSSCQPLRLGAGPSMITGRISKLSIPSPVWTLGPGTYFVRLSPSSRAVWGARFGFEAAFRPHFGHDCATAEPVSASNSGSASIDGELLYPEDRQVFRIVVGEPSQIRAWTSGPLIPPNQPYVDLLMADCSSGAELQAFDSLTNGMATVTLLPGIYYLAIVPEPHTLGTYTLTVEWLAAERWWERILN
jgi:hypothetical protein